MSFRLHRMELVGIGFMAAEASMALYIARYGPSGPLPLHYGLSGSADRWGDRTALAWGLIALVLLQGVALPILRLRRPRAAQTNPQSRNSLYPQLIVIGVFAALTALLAGQAFLSSADVQVGALQTAGLSLVLLVIGAFLGKTNPNYFVGVRTYWSLTSRLAWDKSNRLAGRVLWWAGLVGLLAAPLVPEPQGLRALIAVVLGGALASVFESWRVWRTDPDRTSV
jgi:uncharacterized membrane protein